MSVVEPPSSDTVVGGIDTINLRHHHRHVALIAQHPPNRDRDIGGMEHRRGHLIEQRLKEVVVGAIEQRDAHACVREFLGRPRGRQNRQR